MTWYFYREFTKLNDFTGQTVLGGLHTHVLVLGTLFFLLVLLFEKHFKLIIQTKTYKMFLIVYNIGLISLVIMMGVRGVFEVLSTNLPNAGDITISWLAGINHMIMAAGIVKFFMILIKQIDNIEKENQ
ncbi:DUF2871 family protein [Acholeplasma equifetale]|uniref:DUF2871 family protein n=1 Tax=Acholeplasma equifetale TaxID=264634 RepID=UPI000A02E99F|nr:DUF2871 family protein [Acholeplasma equifetale]